MSNKRRIPALPAPNLSHPADSFISRAISKTSQHQHDSSYHSFISPSNRSSSSTKTSAKNQSFPETLPNAIEALVLNEKLLKWFDTVKESRGMPWRVEVDVNTLSKKELSQRGYEVWVSEIMLQQTQVATVISYYKKWMIQFPTVKSLAAADIEVVNSIWAGLGYYSRASRLLQGAKTVMNEFNGILPIDAKDLEKIDGIGPYSAGAISSIAFGQRAALVDGNVSRVFSRLTALHAPNTAKSTTNFIWALAEILVPSATASIKSGGPNKPGSWSQGLMELGATICTPKNPECYACPLSEECLAYAEVRTLRKAVPFFPTPSSSNITPSISSKKQSNTPIGDIEDCDLCTPFILTKTDHQVTQYPMEKAKKTVREEETSVCFVEWRSATTKDQKVLVVKRPEKGLLAGLYEFPAVDLPPPPAKESTLPTRLNVLQDLLSSLILDRLPSISDAKGIAKSSGTVSLKRSTDLGAILQIYSHQKRNYYIRHIIITSPSLPSLATKSSSTSSSSSKLVQSLPNRGKWIDFDTVDKANLGGAMMKVWEVVQKGEYSNLKPRTKPKAATTTAPTAKKRNATTKKGKSRDEYETEEDRLTDENSMVLEDDDSEVEVEEVVKEDVKKAQRLEVESIREKMKLAKDTASPAKKRKIIIAEDSEDEL